MARPKLKKTDKPKGPHTVVLTDDLWEWVERCAVEKRCYPSDTVQEFGQACMYAAQCGIDVVSVLREMTEAMTNDSSRRTRSTKRTFKH